MENQISYTQAVTELEKIVATLRDENCDIDMLTRYTSRALQLIKACKEKLTKTDEELQKLLAEL